MGGDKTKTRFLDCMMAERVTIKIDALLEEIYGEDWHLVERGEEKVHGPPTYATRNNTQEKRRRRQNGSVTLRNEPAVVSLIKRWGRRSARKKGVNLHFSIWRKYVSGLHYLPAAHLSHFLSLL